MSNEIKAIYIMWLREIKRFFRSKSRVIGALGQPLLFLVALGYGLGPVFQAAGDGNYIQFLAPGIIGMSIIFSSIFNGSSVIWDRQFGFLKETLVAPVSRLSIMFGRALGGATTATFQGIIVVLISALIGFKPFSLTLIPVAILMMFLIAILFNSLGIMVASLLSDMQGFQLIINFLVMPLFFLSGSFFPLQTAAKPLQVVAKLDPLSYGIDGLRNLLTGAIGFGLTLDFLVIIIFATAFLSLGSYFFSKIEV